MKNSLNLVLVILFLVVLGCSCPKMDELSKKPSSSSPSSSPSSSTDNSTPSDTKSSTLTLDKYNKIKNGMTYKEVVEILGSDGTETSNSEIGKYKTVVYKWEGDNYTYVIASFQNDKMSFKSQYGLK